MFKIIALLVVASLPTKVTMDLPLPLKADGGVRLLQTPPIPGSSTKISKLERRIELMQRVDRIKERINTEFDGGVDTFTVLWATQNVSEDADAAILLMNINGSNDAVLFLYKNGAWTVLPEEFVE